MLSYCEYRVSVNHWLIGVSIRLLAQEAALARPHRRCEHPLTFDRGTRGAAAGVRRGQGAARCGGLLGGGSERITAPSEDYWLRGDGVGGPGLLNSIFTPASSITS